MTETLTEGEENDNAGVGLYDSGDEVRSEARCFVCGCILTTLERGHDWNPEETDIAKIENERCTEHHNPG